MVSYCYGYMKSEFEATVNVVEIRHVNTIFPQKVSSSY